VSCDHNSTPNQLPKHYRLEYSLYQAFLEEGNLDQDELFKGLEMMSSPSTIKTFGTKVIAQANILWENMVIKCAFNKLTYIYK